jgi:hypothetical protein
MYRKYRDRKNTGNIGTGNIEAISGQEIYRQYTDRKYTGNIGTGNIQAIS